MTVQFYETTSATVLLFVSIFDNLHFSKGINNDKARVSL